MNKLIINLEKGKKNHHLFRLSILVICLSIYVLIITGYTYAFLNLSANNNVATGEGGCFQVTYSGTELSTNNILSTTDYKESTYSTVTLSKDTSCKIYSYANIYLHTNNTTTAPINTQHALKYKVLTNDGYERNGMITSTNDTLLASVPLTTTETNYIIYLWVDSDLSDGAYHDTSYSGYIYAESTQTSTITTDTTPPSLFLYKESYTEGFEGWTTTNATIENDILTLAPTTTSGSATSPYYKTDGKCFRISFEGYTTTALSGKTTGGIYNGFSYYNSQYETGTSNSGAHTNGVAFSTQLNTWITATDARYTNCSLGQKGTVKYMKMTFGTGNNYSKPITKIRNFKIYGSEIESTSSEITVRAEDNVSITSTKYAKGSHPASYFTNSGTNVTNNKVNVTENGVYTFFVKDAAGNSDTTEIEISNIK